MIQRLVTSFLTCAALCLVNQCIAADDASAPRPSTESSRDLVFYHTDFPIFIRLYLEVDDEGFAARWRRHIASLFKQADTDADGKWSIDEIHDAPKTSSPGLKTILRLSDLWTADEQPDDHISLDELKRFLIYKRMGPFQTPRTVSPRAGRSSEGQNLLIAVDADGDNNLTREELLRATKSLSRHDLNDDGSLSVAEISSQTARVQPGSNSDETYSSVPIAVLNPSEPLTGVVRELERRYGAEIDIPIDSAGFDKAIRDRFDLDNSGDLDSEELRRFLRDPIPSMDLRIRLNSKASFADAVEVVDVKKNGLVSLRKRNRLVSIVIPGVQIELSQNQDGIESARRFLLQSFSAADRDNNDYLDRKETANNEIFGDAFSVIDADDNGMLFKDELIAAFEKPAGLAKVQTRMGIVDRGRNVFQVLDMNRDSRLSSNEFAQAADRIMLWDNDGNSKVNFDEVPRSYALSFGPGQPQIPGITLPDFSAPTPTPNQPAGGPIWFSRMDRNNDNELTRREFLGTRAEFSKLDINSDQAVTIQEADQAEHTFKSQPNSDSITP